MNRIITLLLLTGAWLVLQTSCTKNQDQDTPAIQNPPVSTDSMLRCYATTAWDSATIHNALTGKWNWEFIKCYWKPEEANGDDFSGLAVLFKSNDSLEVTVNGVLTQTASWKIGRTSDGYFKLNVSPLVPQLPGKVLCCGNRVLFYDSYTDGCDNYFKK